MDVNWAQVLFNGVVTASLYLIAAIGLTLTYGLSGFPNFAYAEYIALGAFTGYYVSDGLGLAMPVAFVVSFLFVGLIGFLCYRGIFQPLSKRGATLIHLMVASIALGLILRHLIPVIGDFIPALGWKWAPSYFTARWDAFDFGPLRVTGLWLWTILLAISLAITMHLVLIKTRVGKAIRATANNPELALASGISIYRITWITWFLGAGFAAVAGIFRAADTQIWPMTGWEMILPIFAVVILGGIGNFYGAIAAAFIIGFAENIGVVVLTSLGISTSYRIGIAFIILIITLLIKPQGLAMLFRRS
jgi:branched-subunit amino acid ABC-type transport system permease component